MSNKKKPTELDMILATENLDIHSEVLKIDGCDISDLENGRGRINDNHSKGFMNTIGRITKAKKIFKEEDCTDDRMRYYWSKVKAPYIYAKGILFDDDSEHENARAASSVLRHLNTPGCPIQIKSSVEGGTIRRGGKDDKVLEKTKVHNVALTFSPANTATLVESLSLSKSENPAEDELLIKTAMSMAIDNVPTFIDLNDRIKEQKLLSQIDKLSTLKKGLMAGFGGAGKPTDLTGGGVMQSESVEDGLKSITCSHCGKEQIAQENQVKCRHCNKGFRLKHLIKFTF